MSDKNYRPSLTEREIKHFQKKNIIKDSSELEEEPFNSAEPMFLRGLNKQEETFIYYNPSASCVYENFTIAKLDFKINFDGTVTPHNETYEFAISSSDHLFWIKRWEGSKAMSVKLKECYSLRTAIFTAIQISNKASCQHKSPLEVSKEIY